MMIQIMIKLPVRNMLKQRRFTISMIQLIIQMIILPMMAVIGEVDGGQVLGSGHYLLAGDLVGVLVGGQIGAVLGIVIIGIVVDGIMEDLAEDQEIVQTGQAIVQVEDPELAERERFKEPRNGAEGVGADSAFFRVFRGSKDD